MSAGGHLPAGSAATGPYALRITPESAGWCFSGLRILELAPGASCSLNTGPDEMLVLSLAGAATVQVDSASFRLQGRAGVFAGISDFVYAPCASRLTLHSAHGGRFALPCARAEQRLAPRYMPAERVAVELRGAGAASRQIHNLCTPGVFAAERLIVVEVLTPGGNWSSYPPHKHDEDRPGIETALEEIYYYEVAEAGFGYQRVYTSGPGREIDILAEVRSGDAIVMPHGYHGPSMAAPGYDLYYLNVMAGATERAWRFTYDPDHAWICDSWAQAGLDPRLPYRPAKVPG